MVHSGLATIANITAVKDSNRTYTQKFSTNVLDTDLQISTYVQSFVLYGNSFEGGKLAQCKVLAVV